jgi:hypothetical protein
LAGMMVRGEPEYVDQVPRRQAYEVAHPDVEIIYLGPHWQAIIREENDGKTIITRHSLKALLDKLESLDPPEALDQLPGTDVGAPELATIGICTARTL